MNSFDKLPTRRISILLLFLVGVASPTHFSYYANESADRPIISRSQERRICAELCLSGLGGEPCGEACLDIIPQALLSVSQSDTGDEQVNLTRRSACPVLCKNRLGYPLCGCNETPVTRPFFRPDFLEICVFYCRQYDYHLYGCDECSAYKNMTAEDAVKIVARISKKTYDWNEWCVQMCQEGEGGSACYCDLLPLALELDGSS